MNEEMKIIIKAVTDSAKKSINEVKKELEGVGKTSQTASQKIGNALKGVAKGAAIAVTAIVAVGTALVALGKNTLEIQKSMAQLKTGFEAAGMGANTATKTYKDLFRFMGESDTAVEAANLLAKLTTNEKDLAEWTKTLQGVYATFPDSLPIEALVESSNETARVGKVTGNLADALNWAGVSEDEFNAKLAQTNTLSERETLIRTTLNGLYGEAAEIYERNNKALLDYNESQANLDITMANAGQAILPLMTALNNLGSAFFTALKPALDVIIPVLANFVNWIAKGIQAVTSFFSAITGSATKVKAFGSIGSGAAKAVASGMNGAKEAAQGAAGGAKKAAEEVKKSTQGFDELNIISSGNSGSSAGGSGGGGGGASSPNYANGGGGGLIDNAEFGTEVEETESTGNKLLDKLKKIAEELKIVFAPSISAWGSAFETVKKAWNDAVPDFKSGLQGFKNGFLEIGTYIVNTFVPDIVNSFSVNLAPVFADTLGFAITETGKSFKWLGGIFDDVSTNIIVPALESVKTISTDIFDAIGKAWGKHGKPLLEELGKAYENIRDTLELFYNRTIKPIFEKINTVVNDVWKNGLKPVVENVIDAALEIGACILQLYNDFISPIVKWIIDNIVPLIVKHINKVIDVIGKILKSVMEVVNGVITFFKGLIQFITGVFTGDWSKAWEGIKNMFKGVWETIKGIFSTAWEVIKGVFSVAGSWFSTVWESIKKVFSGVKDWFKSIFSKAWEAIKGVFSSVGTFFGGLWDTIKKKFTSLGSSVASAISNAVKSGLNSVINMIEDTINKGIRLINSAIKLANKLPGINVGTIKEIDLPRLAKGGIIDTATIAMIGEQGKEAVVPLENNTEWIDKLADKLASKTATPSKIVLMVGEKELGWATINSINGITKQTGNLQLTLG